MAAPLATLGVLSIGEMGLGVARLLTANNYRVITNIAGRSPSTAKRAEAASVQLVHTDEDLASQSDCILSIVPPRDALATARRILDVSSSPSFKRRTAPLYYLDLNAVSPRSAREIEELFSQASGQIRLIDGAIIGGPPRPKDDSNIKGEWYCPSLPISGPHKLSDMTPAGAQLAKVLNTKHISPDIGGASGLKMCFASLTKGFTALAIQSFTTAHRLGVTTELQEHFSSYSPKTLELTRTLTTMPPKAYRWVREMQEISATFHEDGGFDKDEDIFGGIAGVYDLVANGTDLGLEKTEDRKRGMDREDVARLMSEGIEKRKLKTD
ncbi:hypothetical protein MBLNU457_1910t2 [Dothideomycetes sp. NU457]